MTPHEAMISRVAIALGENLVARTAFVGGCATALLVTDPHARSQIRFTEDVDLIVHVLGHGAWYQLQELLHEKGFRVSPQDEVNCRLRLRNGGPELIVDFMPDDERILGFSNKWYEEALAQASDHTLPSGILVRVVSPPYFVGTKLEAYRGRGKGDPMSSRDVEDILCLIDGRDSLLDEVSRASPELREDISRGMSALMANGSFEYVVQSFSGGSKARERYLFDRIEALIGP